MSLTVHIESVATRLRARIDALTARIASVRDEVRSLHHESEWFGHAEPRASDVVTAALDTALSLEAERTRLLAQLNDPAYLRSAALTIAADRATTQRRRLLEDAIQAAARLPVELRPQLVCPGCEGLLDRRAVECGACGWIRDSGRAADEPRFPDFQPDT